MSRSIVIPCKPRACWLAFTDPDKLCAWVAGLRSARILARSPAGMPSEIEFEFAAHKYVLAYTYEGTDTAKIVRWYPRTNAAEAVRGWARFGPCDGGTLVEYELVPGPARSDLERDLDHTGELLEAFARWMTDSV